MPGFFSTNRRLTYLSKERFGRIFWFRISSLRRTLFKYLFTEICSVFLVSLLVFLFIILATRMMGITELLISQRVSPGQVLMILLCLLPPALLFSMPATCLVCVLLTFLRLSRDNEIIALNSSGISLYQLLPPAIVFSIMSCLMASFLAIYGVPWGNRSYRGVILDIVESKADLTVKERIFHEPFNGVVFYVNSFSARDRIMRDIFVLDRRESPVTSTIIAREGKILSDRRWSMVTIHFIDGTIFTVDRDFKTVRTITFDSYDLNIDLKEILASFVSKERKPKEMSLWELLYNLKTIPKGTAEYNRMGIEFFQMFTLPVAIFFMGIIGAPLGAQVKSKSRAEGIFSGLAVFLVYYVLLMSAGYVGEMGILSPAVVLWIPVLFLGIVCVYLLRRAANDRPITLPERNPFEGIFRRIRTGAQN